MMSSEHLKEIESRLAAINDLVANVDIWEAYVFDVTFLFKRVKRLTEALEKMLKSEVIKSAQYITYSEVYLNGRKALEEE